MARISVRERSRRSDKPLPIRQQHKLITRERLLDAAVRVFAERGYADATIEDIVAEAALGRATFYLHFKSKLEVMRAIIRARIEQNQALIAELDVVQSPTRDLLESWIRRVVSHWAENGDRFLVGLQALASEPELAGELGAVVRPTSTTLARWLMQRPGIPGNEAALRSELLVSVLQRACRSLVTNPDEYDVDLVVGAVTDMWANDLVGRAPDAAPG